MIGRRLKAIRWWDALVYVTLLAAIIFAITTSTRVTNIENVLRPLRASTPCAHLTTRQCAIKLLGALPRGQREALIRQAARARERLIRQEVRRDRAQARRRAHVRRERARHHTPITTLPAPGNPPMPISAPSGGGGPPGGGNGPSGGSGNNGGSGGHQEPPPLVPAATVPSVTTPVVTTPTVTTPAIPVPPVVCHVLKDC